MPYIDPHIHMISRTTHDYEKMALSGCIGISEPAFWAGFDRSSPRGFFDYFKQLTEFEPKRAGQYGIQHFTWICMNPKESEDLGLSREVISLIPPFFQSPTVLGVGEIGLNRVTRNELTIFEEQMELALQYQQIVMIHTPHLEDKLKGTRILIETLKQNKNVQPERILIEHVEEHTIALALDHGFWAGITLYPKSKMSCARAVDLVENYGHERLMINSGGDWGPSDPLSVPQFRLEMKMRGHRPEIINHLTLQNPAKFMALSGKLSKEFLDESLRT